MTHSHSCNAWTYSPNPPYHVHEWRASHGAPIWIDVGGSTDDNNAKEKILDSAGHDSSTYFKGVYVPTAADRAVITLKQWMTDFGGGGPAWDKNCDQTLPPRESNREVLFNTYDMHTKKCSTCMTALKNTKRLLAAAKTSTVLSLAWSMLRGARAVAASPSSPVLNTVTARAMLPGVALTLASLGVVKGLEMFHGMFYSVKFDHQDSD